MIAPNNLSIMFFICTLQLLIYIVCIYTLHFYLFIYSIYTTFPLRNAQILQTVHLVLQKEVNFVAGVHLKANVPEDLSVLIITICFVGFSYSFNV